MNNKIKIAHLNVRSLTANFNNFRDFVVQNDYDIVGVSETWLTTNVTSESISIYGYNIIRCDRISRGGGICIYIKKKFKYTKIGFMQNINEFLEHMWIQIKSEKITLGLGIIYRPPNTNIQNFFDIFEETIASMYTQCDNVICMGDFNINLLDLMCSNAKQFQTLIDGIGLKQIIMEPTRITRNTQSLIDYIILDSLITYSNCNVKDANISDHCAVTCDIHINTKKTKPTYRTYRDFSNFNNELFNLDLRKIQWQLIYEMQDINNMVSYFNENLLSIFDIHAPMKTARFTRPPAPWLTDNIKFMMTLRDKALKKYKKSKNIDHFNYYKQLRNYTNFAISTEKKRFMEHRLRNLNSKQTWKALRHHFGINNKSNLLKSNLNKNANEINTFFSSICTRREPDRDIINFYENNLKTPIQETLKFNCVSEDYVSKIIININSKACGLDGINITLIQLSCPFLIPYITHIINVCIEKSIFPTGWKEGRVVPVPKIDSPQDLKDLRPITILPTLSKILERIIETQLRDHIAVNDILPSTQSGFRPGFSCGTALLSITDDIITEIDNKNSGVLILLDYSKAFDTISHEILLSILHYIGLSFQAIELIKNYLADRSQKVILEGEMSNSCAISRGIPQGSILGPLFYTIYTLNLPSVLNTCKVHMYADDTQLYHFFDKHNLETVLPDINKDIDDLVKMSRRHDLMINSNKSSVLLFGNIQPNVVDIKLGEDRLEIVEKTKNLGIIIDKDLRFSDHVSFMLKKAYGNLKMLYSHRHVFSVKLKTLLCNSLVLSQFNYCDYVYGPCLTVKDCNRIQKAQNSCLRLIHGIRKYDRISYTLSTSRWLNMENRRKLHANVLYYKILINKTPSYLYNKVKYRTDIHNINIRRKNHLTIPKHRTAMFQRSFSFNIAKNMNTLSIDIRFTSLGKFYKYIHDLLFLEQERRQ